MTGRQFEEELCKLTPQPGERWAVEIAGTSQTTILKRDGTPVARFYAGRLTLPECFEVAAKLNAMEPGK